MPNQIVTTRATGATGTTSYNNHPLTSENIPANKIINHTKKSVTKAEPQQHIETKKEFTTLQKENLSRNIEKRDASKNKLRRKIEIEIDLVYRILYNNLCLENIASSGSNMTKDAYSKNLEDTLYKLKHDYNALKKYPNLDAEDNYITAKIERTVAFFKLVCDNKYYCVVDDKDRLVTTKHESTFNFLMSFFYESNKLQEARNIVKNKELNDTEKQKETDEILFAINYFTTIVVKIITCETEIDKSTIINQVALKDDNKKILQKTLDLLANKYTFKHNPNNIPEAFTIFIGYSIIGNHEQALNILTNLNIQLKRYLYDPLSHIFMDHKKTSSINKSIITFNIINHHRVKNMVTEAREDKEIKTLNDLPDSSPFRIQLYADNLRKTSDLCNKITEKLWHKAINRIPFQNLSINSETLSFIEISASAFQSLVLMDAEELESYINNYWILIKEFNKTNSEILGHRAVVLQNCTPGFKKSIQSITKLSKIKIPEPLDKNDTFCTGMKKLRTMMMQQNKKKFLLFGGHVSMRVMEDIHKAEAFLEFLKIAQSSNTQEPINLNTMYNQAIAPYELHELENINNNFVQHKAQLMLASEESSKSLLLAKTKQQPTKTLPIENVISSDETSDDEKPEVDKLNVAANNNNSDIADYYSILEDYYKNPKENINKAIDDLVKLRASNCGKSQMLACYALVDILNTHVGLIMEKIIENIKLAFLNEVEKYLEEKEIIPNQLYNKFKRNIQSLIPNINTIELYMIHIVATIPKLLDLYSQGINSTSIISQEKIEDLTKSMQQNKNKAAKFDMIVQKMQDIINMKKTLNSYFYSNGLLIDKSNEEEDNFQTRQRSRERNSIKDFSQKKIITTESLHCTTDILKKILVIATTNPPIKNSED